MYDLNSPVFFISFCSQSSYATFSNGIPWNITRVTCISRYTRKPLENKSDKPGKLHVINHERELHNYFIACHRKYSFQHNIYQCST